MTSTPWKIAPTIRAVLLIRESTKKQAGKRTATRRGKLISERSDKVSDQLQAEKCRALARGLHLGITDAEMQSKPDIGVSGLNEQRVEEIVKACEASPRPPMAPGYVIALNVSRFSRLDGLRAMGFIDRLDRAGWLLRFDFPRRSGVPIADNTMLVMLIEMAAEYSRQLKENVAPAMRRYAEAGEVQGGRPVPGYTVNADGHYEPKPDTDPEVTMMRRAFADFAAGATLDAVAQRAGMLATTMRGRLKNPTYVGTLAWGRRKGSQISGMKEGAHPALIDRATWDQVQARLAENGTRPPRRTDRVPYVLSGRVRGACGHVFFGAGGLRKNATHAEWLKYSGYRCKKCGASRVNQVKLEAAVLSTVVRYLTQEDESGRLDRRMQKWVAAQLGASSTAARDAQRTKLQVRKTALLAVAGSDPDVTKALNTVIADLAKLDSPVKPNRKAIEANAAAMLAKVRAFIAQGANITAEAANQSLATLLPLIPAISYDPATRLVEVSFLSPFETLTALVPHSGEVAACRAT